MELEAAHGCGREASTPVFLGRVGEHNRVELPCLVLFASPRPCMKTHARVNLTGSTTGARRVTHHAILTGLKLARVLARVSVESLAKLGMTHLDRTEWENTEYRKRDFFIRCGSDNVGIYGI
ncbi:hypothetical protein GOBAR_AA38719 [Gossypium barbadense]|uniref:Uncharacterized protein n=1 Tax=Gossypium barbadense TaxID=3634 RepID=A0A2P5VT27_GOSBA|nr:hypothetical protein GOBAR_AA38719 [Gossypium barbadense]